MKYLIITLVLFFMACKNENVTDTESIANYTFKLPEWAKSASIYEANTRHMTEKGDFKGVESHLERIADMGIDIIWLMPIHPISVKNRKAKGDLFAEQIEDPEERKLYLGSPYSVADYKKVNPDYGTMEDFKSLLQKAHELNMKVIIDWVPNHTGWDNPWIFEHPEWYTQDSTGKIIDPIDASTGKSWGWTDVADLNYDNKEMRAAMIDAMKYWIEEVGIDGFRVDVAHGIPQDFWDEACKALVTAKPDIFLLAESEVPSNLNNKTFHVDYGWSFHHLINDIAKGKKKASDIIKWLEADNMKYTEGMHMHFTSNHDENTWAGTVFDRLGDAHKTMAVLTCTFEGIPLLYSGMEEPMTKRLAFFTKDHIAFEKYAYADFYKTLFNLKERNKALWNGIYGAEPEIILEDENVFAYKREKEGDKFICFLNLSDEKQTVTIPEDIKLKDVFTKQDIDWKKDTALALEPWQYYVLSNR